MNTWQVRVRNYTRGDGDALVAQRLKRLPSIERKLARFENSQLDTMQDLGGVRAVLADVDQVRAVEKLLLSRPGNHVLKQHDDYLSMPKDDGYRSVHIAYA
ncbi:RelA/SpoT domain-containing protein [Microbacterium sp. NPDC076768]